MKSELNDLRERIYKNLKRKAYSFEGEVSAELKSYRNDQLQSSKRPFYSSDINELKDSVMESQLIYLGDFHTFDQNIRNVLRILKVIANNHMNEGRDCVIGLEMVDAKYQYCLDAYMQNHLTELEFLESIAYHDSWRFPWTHYKLIFELAREHGIRMIALNTKGSLEHRDRFAAKLLDQTLKESESRQIVVVYGEYHINPDKIPALLENIRPQAKQTIIHQNLDEVYWKMRSDSQESKIVKFSEHEFCINSAPPWVKYESMIYWYENMDNDPDFDIHEYIIEKGKKIFNEDIHDNFLAISQELASAVSLNLSEEDLENFNLYDHTGLEYIEEKIQALSNKELSEFYNNLIATGQSFRLPNKSTFYCSSYSMNRITYLAGTHIFHVCLQESGTVDFFTLFTFEHMYGYFFSKLMNPHRKCEMYWNLQAKLTSTETSAESSEKANCLQACLSILDGHKPKEALKELSLIEIHMVSQFIGHIYGEYLYTKLSLFGESIGGKFLKRKLDFKKDILSIPVSEQGLSKIRGILLEDMNYRQHKKRYF